MHRSLLAQLNGRLVPAAPTACDEKQRHEREQAKHECEAKWMHVSRYGELAPPVRREALARGLIEGLVFVVVPCCLLLVIAFLAPRATYASDFHPFWQAAGDVVHGRNPYTHATTLNSLGTPESRYIYPPLVADLLVPLAPLPFLAAAVVFLLVSTAAIPLALWLLGVRDWRCYGMAFLWIPVVHGIRLGALTPLLILGVAACWRYRDSALREQPRRRARRRHEDLHVAAARLAGRAGNAANHPLARRLAGRASRSSRGRPSASPGSSATRGS